MVRLDLEDLLVEGARLGQETFVAQTSRRSGRIDRWPCRPAPRGRTDRRGCCPCSSRAGTPRRCGDIPQSQGQAFPAGAVSRRCAVLQCGRSPRINQSYQTYRTASKGGTIDGARRNSRSGRRHRGGRRWRSPCGGRSRTGGRCPCSASIWRSRVTFAMIDAAAIAEHRRSPWGTPRCAIGRSGTRNASTSTMSGSGASAITARCIAFNDA